MLRWKDEYMAIQVILFDLDNTIYPASSGLMQSIDQRIGEFVQRSLGLSEEEALRLRRHYYAEFGTTLRGLQHHHQYVETESYLQYVHDLALEAFLVSDERLDAMLAALNARKVIFTNSPREHAERVLKTLGIAHHFERIFDLRYFDFVAKPEPAAYVRVLQELGVGNAGMVRFDRASGHCLSSLFLLARLPEPVAFLPRRGPLIPRWGCPIFIICRLRRSGADGRTSIWKSG